MEKEPAAEYFVCPVCRKISLTADHYKQFCSLECSLKYKKCMICGKYFIMGHEKNEKKYCSPKCGTIYKIRRKKISSKNNPAAEKREIIFQRANLNLILLCCDNELAEALCGALEQLLKIQAITYTENEIKEDITVYMISDKIEPRKSGFILCNYPAFLNQAEELEKEYGIDAALYINIAEDEKENDPLISRYRDKKILWEIRESDIKKIIAKIISILSIEHIRYIIRDAQ